MFFLLVPYRKHDHEQDSHVQFAQQSNSLTDSTNDQEVFIRNPCYNNTLQNERNIALNSIQQHSEGTHSTQNGLKDEQKYPQISTLEEKEFDYASILLPKISDTVPQQSNKYNVLQRIGNGEYNKLQKVPEYATPTLPSLSDVESRLDCDESKISPHPYSEPVQIYSVPSGDPHPITTERPHVYAEIEQTVAYTDSQGYAELDQEYDDVVAQKNTGEPCSVTDLPSTVKQNSNTVQVTPSVYENLGGVDYVNALDYPVASEIENGHIKESQETNILTENTAAALEQSGYYNLPGKHD